MVNIAETLNDLKSTLKNLYYALDDEWHGSGDPFDAEEIKSIADKYGWSKDDILSDL